MTPPIAPTDGRLGLTLRATDTRTGAVLDRLLDRFPLRIGRSALNGLRLDFPFISQFHVVIEQVGDKFILRDLGSRNGTSAGGARFKSHQPIDLATVGFAFDIGPAQFRCSPTPIHRTPTDDRTNVMVAIAESAPNATSVWQALVEEPPQKQRDPAQVALQGFRQLRRFPSMPVLLAQLAAMVAAGSGCALRQGSCDGYAASQKDIAVTPDVACAIASQGGVTRTTGFNAGLYGNACSEACGAGFGMCDLTVEYVKAYQAALPAGDAGSSEAGDAEDASAGPDSAASSCPVITGTVKVHCSSYPCEGRRTDGIDEPMASNEPGIGAYFATCSYLEAVSVHAFARLRVELAAHGAPGALLALVRRAELDEVRHAELTGRLARRFGVEPEEPIAPPDGVRSLHAIALENAVEGCVRETYGAASACFRAIRAQDPLVRVAMESIARDECEHAELAFHVAAWIAPLLRDDERDAIHVAMREAMDDLVEQREHSLDDVQRLATGLPTAEERRCLADLVDREVVRRRMTIEDTSRSRPA